MIFDNSRQSYKHSILEYEKEERAKPFTLPFSFSMSL